MKYLLLSVLLLFGFNKKSVITCDQRIYIGDYITVGSEQQQTWKLEWVQPRELKFTCLTHKEVISFNCANCKSSNDSIIICSNDNKQVQIQFTGLFSNDCIGENKFTKLEYIEAGKEMFTCIVECTK